MLTDPAISTVSDDKIFKLQLSSTNRGDFGMSKFFLGFHKECNLYCDKLMIPPFNEGLPMGDYDEEKKKRK